MGKRELARMHFPVAGYESGKTVPDRSEIVRLSMVLGFPPGWFTKPWDPKLDGFEGTFHLCESHVWCDEDDGCGERAVAQCDYPLAGGGTCDKNICAGHGKRVGANRDYCDSHLAKHRQAEPERSDAHTPSEKSLG